MEIRYNRGMECWTLYFDGACEPFNPGGHATYGWCLYGPEGQRFEGNGHVCSGIGATNNVAEFHALEAGLRYMVEHGIVGLKISLICKGDSQLVVNQVSGQWAIRKLHLEAIAERVWFLLEQITSDWSIHWIPREENSECDALSKKAVFPRIKLKYPEWWGRYQYKLKMRERTK